MPKLPSRGIFLSYRREEAAAYARLLKSEFSERIPDARVFMDLDSIGAGQDFGEVIRQALDSSTVLVALIGRYWTTLTDEDGQRKLDNPDDWVRFEIHAALERDIWVLPVLVDGARPLRLQQLPSELHQLARLNAFELSANRYQYDADRLVDLIRKVLGEASGTDGADESPPSADAESPIVALPPNVPPGQVAVPGEAAHEHAEPARRNRVQVTRVLADAERIAESISDESMKALALVDVAKAVAASEPDRAARLNADAEDTVQSMPEYTGDMRTMALLNLAMRLAATDPDRAERITRSITEPSFPAIGMKAMALANLAVSLAAADPDRAAQLDADAEDVVQSIRDESFKLWALTEVVGILTAADPDRAGWLIGDAERMARSITDESDKARALANVAMALAATESDRAAWLIGDAERIAQSISDESSKAMALAYIAPALATTDPDRAIPFIADVEGLAELIADEYAKVSVLAELVRALAVVDPDRGERLLQSIADPSAFPRAPAVSRLVRSLAATDPGRAERLARSTADELARAAALAELAEALAATDPGRAEYIARSITDKSLRVRALVAIAEAGAP